MMAKDDSGLRYRVVRFYARAGRPSEIVASGLSAEEAQARCSDPEGSSKTATSDLARRRTRRYGEWFEGFEADRPTEARTVIERHTELARHMLHPSELWASFVSWFALDVSKRGGASDEATALYPYRPSLGEEQAKGWCRAVGRSLAAARTYQVTAPMVDAVTGVYRQTTKGIFHISETDLPVEHGFAWLDKALVLEDRHRDQLRHRAITWGVTTARYKLPDGTIDESPAVRLTIWCWTGDDGYFGDDMKADDEEIRRLGEFTPIHTLVLPFGVRLPAGKMENGNDNVVHWAYTLWLFLGTEIPASQPARLDSRTKRRAFKVLRHTDVNVITLRRHYTVGDEVVEARDVDWSCRWVVQGHWRHLESYDGQPHQARVLKDATVDGHLVCRACRARVTWVKTYLKGPEDKPLKAASPQLYKLTR